MSISRRIFLKVGTIAAVAAGISLRPSVVAFGQQLGDIPATVQNDPLSYYTMATFTQYLNSVFTVRAFTTVEVTLTKVEDTLSANTSRAGGRESFVLLFQGGSAQLPQDTYVLEHPALGTFRLFLVPNGTDENGAQGYVATINRLAYTARPKAPRRELTSKKPATSMPAASTPQSRPANSPQIPAESQTDKPKPKKVRPDSPEFDLDRLNF